MSSRELIYDDGSIRKWQCYDDSGAPTTVDTETYPLVGQTNTDTLRANASNALPGNSTFLALATPTLDDVTAQLQHLTRQVNAVARLVLGQTDTTADT